MVTLLRIAATAAIMWVAIYLIAQLFETTVRWPLPLYLPTAIVGFRCITAGMGALIALVWGQV